MAKATVSGIPAARQRPASWVQERGTQLPVDRRVPERGGVGEVDGDLTVLDASGGAGVLALHAHRVRALLQVAGLVHDQHRVLVVQVLDDEAAQVIAYRVCIPPGPGQQVLQTVRVGVPGMLGERPAVLARQVRQQPEHQRPGPAPGFNPTEPSRDATHQDLEHFLPAARIYAVTCGHRLIFCLHTPMITGGRTHSGPAPTSKIAIYNWSTKMSPFFIGQGIDPRPTTQSGRIQSSNLVAMSGLLGASSTQWSLHGSVMPGTGEHRIELGALASPTPPNAGSPATRALSVGDVDGDRLERPPPAAEPERSWPGEDMAAAIVLFTFYLGQSFVLAPRRRCRASACRAGPPGTAAASWS